jgi:hypothetical protein
MADVYFKKSNMLRFELFFSFGCTAQFWALAASMKLPVSFRLLDLGQSAGVLVNWSYCTVRNLLVGLAIYTPT